MQNRVFVIQKKGPTCPNWGGWELIWAMPKSIYSILFLRRFTLRRGMKGMEYECLNLTLISIVIALFAAPACRLNNQCLFCTNLNKFITHLRRCVCWKGRLIKWVKLQFGHRARFNQPLPIVVQPVHLLLLCNQLLDQVKLRTALRKGKKQGWRDDSIQTFTPQISPSPPSCLSLSPSDLSLPSSLHE